MCQLSPCFNREWEVQKACSTLNTPHLNTNGGDTEYLRGLRRSPGLHATRGNFIINLRGGVSTKLQYRIIFATTLWSPRARFHSQRICEFKYSHTASLIFLNRFVTLGCCDQPLQRRVIMRRRLNIDCGRLKRLPSRKSRIAEPIPPR